MSQSNWFNWRTGVTLLIIILACVAFYDTFELWTMSDQAKEKLQERDPDALLNLQQKAIHLGLDLQGGIHVVLRVKLEELDQASRSDAVDRAMQIIRNRVDGLGVAEPSIFKQGNDRIVVDLPGYTDADRAEELIGQTALLQFKLMETVDNANLLLQKMDSLIAENQAEKSGESESGETTTADSSSSEMAETQDSSKASSDKDVVSELLGEDSTEADTSDLFAFDESNLEEGDYPLTSRLELALYNSRTGTAWPMYAVNKSDREKVERWLNLPSIQHLMQEDKYMTMQWAWSTRSEIRNSREVYYLYLLRRKVQFLGKFLENISLGRDQMGGFVVNFSLSGDGASAFARLTGANIDKPLAIVLDDKVESAPMINSKIRRRGQITMGGSASIDDARDMEIVLKAGALPAPVEIIEKNVVGATLGADSITKGFKASLLGLLLVLVFIGIYYRTSGLIADVGLIFNIFFLLAVMSALHATLTMPGIAGIILTIGMSVDSNILIFERIREELRKNKGIKESIKEGYKRAFVAIFDSHVTTLITAGALFLLGSGPIKGFAVTLFYGIVISLYTAFVITKQAFDIRQQYKTLGI